MADHLLSSLTSGGGGVRSIQTGHINNQATSISTGEDLRYVDVTITAVTVANCVALFQGSIALSTGDAGFYTGTASQGIVTARMTSTTNLRLAFAAAAYGFMTGRWYVIEYS